MIKSIEFENFKALRKTTLPLGRFTLIVGPNGSGKTTALQALWSVLTELGASYYEKYVSAGADEGSGAVARVIIQWDSNVEISTTEAKWTKSDVQDWTRKTRPPRLDKDAVGILKQSRIYTLDADVIAAPIQLETRIFLGTKGQGLAGVLDRLRDEHPERFEKVNVELSRWLPEFDRILFETPNPGMRAIRLRTSESGESIGAQELSQGTLLALAMLTIAYLPEPPPIVAFEEPDRGIHPRLLRDVQDALYRLSYPESFGEDREPVQVIATTHSPYMLDLYKDHPEEIVIASKEGAEAKFQRLIDLPNYEEILQDTHLGDAWYSGILGGVPVKR